MENPIRTANQCMYSAADLSRFSGTKIPGNPNGIICFQTSKKTSIPTGDLKLFLVPEHEKSNSASKLCYEIPGDFDGISRTSTSGVAHLTHGKGFFCLEKVEKNEMAYQVLFFFSVFLSYTYVTFKR